MAPLPIPTFPSPASVITSYSVPLVYSLFILNIGRSANIVGKPVSNPPSRKLSRASVLLYTNDVVPVFCFSIVAPAAGSFLVRRNSTGLRLLESIICKLQDGSVVPIPTLPSDLIRIHSLPSVPIGC